MNLKLHYSAVLKFPRKVLGCCSEHYFVQQKNGNGLK